MLKRSFGILTILLLLTACSTTLNLTSEARYYSALKTFNDVVETYLASYDKASPESQAKWSSTIDPVILNADAALSLWKTSLGSTEASTRESVYTTTFNSLISLLTSSGILEVK